jgi:hypothetical protein
MISAKEKLVEHIRKGGYDFVSACEEADRVITEFLNSKDKKRVYYFRHSNGAVELKRKD